MSDTKEMLSNFLSSFQSRNEARLNELKTENPELLGAVQGILKFINDKYGLGQSVELLPQPDVIKIYAAPPMQYKLLLLKYIRLSIKKIDGKSMYCEFRRWHEIDGIFFAWNGSLGFSSEYPRMIESINVTIYWEDNIETTIRAKDVKHLYDRLMQGERFSYVIRNLIQYKSLFKIPLSKIQNNIQTLLIDRDIDFLLSFDDYDKIAKLKLPIDDKTKVSSIRLTLSPDNSNLNNNIIGIFNNWTDAEECLLLFLRGISRLTSVSVNILVGWADGSVVQYDIVPADLEEITMEQATLSKVVYDITYPNNKFTSVTLDSLAFTDFDYDPRFVVGLDQIEFAINDTNGKSNQIFTTSWDVAAFDILNRPEMSNATSVDYLILWKDGSRFQDSILIDPNIKHTAYLFNKYVQTLIYTYKSSPNSTKVLNLNVNPKYLMFDDSKKGAKPRLPLLINVQDIYITLVNKSTDKKYLYIERYWNDANKFIQTLTDYDTRDKYKTFDAEILWEDQSLSHGQSLLDTKQWDELKVTPFSQKMKNILVDKIFFFRLNHAIDSLSFSDTAPVQAGVPATTTAAATSTLVPLRCFYMMYEFHDDAKIYRDYANTWQHVEGMFPMHLRKFPNLKEVSFKAVWEDGTIGFVPEAFSKYRSNVIDIIDEKMAISDLFKFGIERLKLISPKNISADTLAFTDVKKIGVTKIKITSKAKNDTYQDFNLGRWSDANRNALNTTRDKYNKSIVVQTSWENKDTTVFEFTYLNDYKIINAIEKGRTRLNAALLSKTMSLFQSNYMLDYGDLCNVRIPKSSIEIPIEKITIIYQQTFGLAWTKEFKQWSDADDYTFVTLVKSWQDINYLEIEVYWYDGTSLKTKVLVDSSDGRQLKNGDKKISDFVEEEFRTIGTTTNPKRLYSFNTLFDIGVVYQPKQVVTAIHITAYRGKMIFDNIYVAWSAANKAIRNLIGNEKIDNIAKVEVTWQDIVPQRGVNKFSTAIFTGKVLDDVKPLFDKLENGELFFSEIVKDFDLSINSTITSRYEELAFFDMVTTPQAAPSTPPPTSSQATSVTTTATQNVELESINIETIRRNKPSFIRNGIEYSQWKSTTNSWEMANDMLVDEILQYVDKGDMILLQVNWKDGSFVYEAINVDSDDELIEDFKSRKLTISGLFRDGFDPFDDKMLYTTADKLMIKDPPNFTGSGSGKGEPVKSPATGKKRGRPKKQTQADVTDTATEGKDETASEIKEPKKRGRPKKIVQQEPPKSGGKEINLQQVKSVEDILNIDLDDIDI
jgi:hypothetical protein